MKINRKLTIKQLLEKLPFESKYLDPEIVNSLKNEGEVEVELEFFNLGRYVSASELIEEYKKRNLIPDFGAVITYILRNPSILEEKKFISVQSEKDNIFVTFSRSFEDKRFVRCGRNGARWSGVWWFGGRKVSENLDSGSSGSLVLEHLENIERETKEIKGVNKMPDELERLLIRLQEILKYQAQEEVFQYIDMNYTTKQISVAKLRKVFKKKRK